MGKKDTDEEATEEGGKKKGKGKLIIVAVLCVALAGAGYFAGGMMGGDAAAPVATAPPEPKIETYEDLEAVNINLSDGHYLRIKVSLGLAKTDHAEAGGDAHGMKAGAKAAEEPAEPEFNPQPAADLVLTIFSGRSIEDLNSKEGREHAREELLHGLQEYYGEHVLAVYFTEFVMQ